MVGVEKSSSARRVNSRSALAAFDKSSRSRKRTVERGSVHTRLLFSHTAPLRISPSVCAILQHSAQRNVPLHVVFSRAVYLLNIPKSFHRTSTKLLGAAEARRAHNPEDARSKRAAASFLHFWSISIFLLGDSGCRIVDETTSAMLPIQH